MERNKGKKYRQIKIIVPSPPDSSGIARTLPRNLEILSLLFDQVTRVLAFLEPTHKRHQFLLNILHQVATAPRSVLARRVFLRLIAAASDEAFASGGPVQTPLLEYIDRDKLATAVGQYQTATTILRQSTPTTLDFAELRKCAETFQRWVEAENALIDVFSHFQKEVISSLELGADNPDKNADTRTKSRISLPKNVDVIRLAKLINDNIDSEGSQMAIAMQFADGDEKRAKSLLRQLRRFPVLRKQPLI